MSVLPVPPSPWTWSSERQHTACNTIQNKISAVPVPMTNWIRYMRLLRPYLWPLTSSAYHWYDISFNKFTGCRIVLTQQEINTFPANTVKLFTAFVGYVLTFCWPLTLSFYLCKFRKFKIHWATIFCKIKVCKIVRPSIHPFISYCLNFMPDLCEAWRLKYCPHWQQNVAGRQNVAGPGNGDKFSQVWTRD